MEQIMKQETIFEAFEKSCQSQPNAPAVQLNEKGNWIRYSYNELRQKAIEGKNHLVDFGIKAGDRIGILSENRPEWVAAFLAILSINATVVPLDYSATPEDLAYLINFSDLKAILVSHKATKKFEILLPALPAERPCISLHDWQPLPHFYSRVFSSRTKDEDPSLAAILFTSGKTGLPKGVMLTHSALLHNARSVRNVLGIKTSERLLSVVPLNHMYGLGTILLWSLLSTSCLTFLEDLNREAIFSILEKEKISIIPAVPRLYESFYHGILQRVNEQSILVRVFYKFLEKISKTGNRFGLRLGKLLFPKIHKLFGGHILLMASGGAPLPAQIVKQYDIWGFQVLNAYGMTEFSPVISINHFDENIFGTVGKVISDCELKIDKANILGEGEVCVRGPSLMKGYFRNAEDTEQTIKNGWLHTGDLGKLNDKGFLTLTGRIKELIVTSGGKKASPEEIEQYYSHILGIKDLAIVGLRSKDKFGEEIAAAIVPQNPHYSEDEKNKIIQSIHHKSTTVPPHLRVQHIYFLNEIPKTSTLKYKHNKIKELLESGGLKQEIKGQKNKKEQPRDEIDRRVIHVLRNEFSERLSANQDLNDLNLSLQYSLGIDSLGRMDLGVAIEKEFNLKIAPEKIFAALTLGDLASLIREELVHLPNRLQKTVETKQIPIRTSGSLPFWSTPLILLIKNLSCLFWGMKVKGTENIPQSGNCIFVPNHQTPIDVFFVMSYLPRKLRKRLRTLSKKENFEQLGTRFFAKAAGGIPVDRLGPIQLPLEQGLHELQQGNSLLIHPEGTRSKTGALGSFQRGAAYLAARSQVPLIPVYIKGGSQIYPPQLRLPRLFDWRNFKRYQLEITFGKPIYPNNDIFSREEEEKLTQQIRAAIVKLSQV